MIALQRLLSRFRKDEAGAAILFTIISLPFIIGMAALAVDFSYVFYVRSRLQAAADMGALAGGTLMYKSTQKAMTDKAVEYVGLNLPTNWNATSNGIKIDTTATAVCLTAIKNLGLTCDGSSSSNALTVTVTATIPLFFGNAFGFTTATQKATATVSGANASPPPLNIAIVLDTTRSMGNQYTGSCGSVNNPTKLTCAIAGVQGMLGTLWPSVDQVSLFIFPGVTAASVPYEYCSPSSGKTVTVTNYKTASNPTYKIVDFSTDYRGSGTPPPAGLNSASNLVKALGYDTKVCSGLQAPGGVSTYYADAVSQAQAALVQANTALVAAGQKPRQNVIVLLSDGDANASTTNIDTAKQPKQCNQAIVNAASAKAAGTWVYSIAYEANNSGGCSTDTGITACAAMKAIASDPSKFYSVGGSGNCVSSSNPNTTDLISIFKNVATSLLKMRRVPNGMT